VENNKYLSRRDTLKILGLAAGSALLASCAPGLLDTPTPDSTAFPTMGPTMTPFQPPTVTASPSETPAPTETATLVPVEDLFKLGPLDVGVTPLTIATTPKLMETLGYIFTAPRKYFIDKPYEIKLPYLDATIQDHFDSAAADNSHGNPSMVFTTDRKLLVEYVHSMQPGSSGELGRIIGSFVIKHPDRLGEILGKEVTITPKGGATIVSTIADVRTVTAEQFESLDPATSFWGVYPDRENVLILRTDRMGIPDSIRDDFTPGVYYLTLITCQPQDGYFKLDDPNHPGAESFHNTRNRTILTLKFSLP